MIPNKRATIKQVAKEAGVSTQTVSRVINERPDVAPETRERILQVIERLNYQPSAIARSLIQQRSFTLGVVTAGLKFIGPSRTLNAIAERSAELGYALLLEELPRFDTENIRPLLQNLLARHVDGILWAVPQVGENRRWVREILDEVPVPVLFLTMETNPGVTTVSIDNYAGATLAVRHLLDQGFRRIGHVSGPLDWWEARERKKAWADTLTEAGYAPTERNWVEGNWSTSSGELAIEHLLEAYTEMDAVFVANDQMSLAVMRFAHQHGIRIPEDLAVVGFDNLSESAYYWPALTTVNQNNHELGCSAVQELVDQIEAEHQNNKLEAKNKLIPAVLVVRESSINKHAKD